MNHDPETHDPVARDQSAGAAGHPQGTDETAPAPDTDGSSASATGNTVTGGPASDKPTTADTDEA